MSFPERRFSSVDQCLSTVGALALVPSARIIELYDLPEYQRPRSLITKQSLRTYQDISERYSQSIARSAWQNLLTCVPGTKPARNNQSGIDHRTPDFTPYATWDQAAKTVLGFSPVRFSFIATEAAERLEYIPRMGPTAAGFLLDLAEIIEVELETSE